MDDRHSKAAREMLAEARRSVEAMLGSSRPANAYVDAMRRLDAAEARIAEALGKLEAQKSRLDTRDASELAEAPKRPSELADHWWATAAKLEAEVGADNDAVQMLRKCSSELDAILPKPSCETTAMHEALWHKIEALTTMIEALAVGRLAKAHPDAHAERGRADSEKWCAGKLRSILASFKPDAPKPGMFYIQHLYVCGDCAAWWRPSASGYTADLAEAGLYSEDEVSAIRHPSADRPWPREVVDRMAVRHVRVEALRDADPAKEPGHG